MTNRLVLRNCMYGLFLSAALAAARPIPVYAQEQHPFLVDGADTMHAIQDFGNQAGLQIFASADELSGKHLHDVRGVMSTDVAFKTLLTGTGLTQRYLGERLVALVWNEPSRASASSDPSARIDSSADIGPQAPEPLRDTDTKLEEVVVTAQKKGAERLLDTPLPVAVLNTEQLVQTGQVLLRDYYASIPALSLSPNFAGQQMLSIRGITTGGFTQAVVGIALDDVPVAAGNQVPDIDPGDLARIEVLRGPQGSLYGSNSMGGLVRYVTVDPSTLGYSARLEAGTDYVHNGAEPGFNVRGSANIPLGDTLAVRVSGFTRQDPGYIDNPVLHEKGVNQGESTGAHLTALWRPSSDLSLKLNALYQRSFTDVSSDVNVPTPGFPQTAGLGDLQQNYIPGIGGYDRTLQIYSAVLNANLGALNLTSISAYNINRYTASLDFSSIFGPSLEKPYGVGGSAYIDRDNITQFSQELRLSGSLGNVAEWLLAGFYSHQNAPDYETFTVQNPTTGQVILPTYWSFAFPNDSTEYAAFANLTYHFTDRFNVQVGARESRDSAGQHSVQSGPYIGPSALVSPPIEAHTSAFTYLVTPQWQISANSMVYARLASGFRPGGPNPPASGVQIPLSYAPDKTYNYELGAKGDFWNHAFTLDASLYYIDWKNIQVQRTDVVTFNTNGSGAKSEGVELSVTARPLQGLTIAGWVAYDNAVLTKAFPPGPTYGVPGDRLPNTPEWSGNLSIREEFPLAPQATGFVSGVVTYVGNRLSVFGGSANEGSTGVQRQTFPAYTKADLRAGVNYGPWTTSLYVNNVADSRGMLNGGIGFDPAFAFEYIQPRTIGASLVRTF